MAPSECRRPKAARAAQQLAKKRGRDLKPIAGGEAWCDSLESHSDYENRLPRGRTYVRNGSIYGPTEAKGFPTGGRDFSDTRPA